MKNQNWIFGKFSYETFPLFNVPSSFPRKLELFKESLDAFVEMGTFLKNVKAIKNSKEQREKKERII